ncbi:uncharacterized protein LOC134277763, partial [Saccostrea cucullata]|uniref:uncharacterized protein LOC134277763 n=1 Tax=Saccostrea cuccullata TaxID=36930 RepID=UPI002ED3E7E5
MAIKKDDGDYIDPTKYLEFRPVTMPKWKQECDDYKLVFKGVTLAAGVIVGLGGQKEENNNTQIANASQAKPIDDLPKSSEPEYTKEIKDNPESAFSKFKFKMANEQDEDEDKKDSVMDIDSEDECAAYRPQTTTTTTTTTASPLTTAAPPRGFIGFFKKLLKAADKFLEKYNIRRLKFGTIIEFLDKLGMNESKEAMAKVMITIKELIDNKPCVSPQQMTDDELMNELIERGKRATGTREEMIDTLLRLDQNCPLVSFTMPKNVYCTFDHYCLGMECCVNVKLMMFLKVFKFYARLDPCSNPLKFVFGFDQYNYTVEINETQIYEVNFKQIFNKKALLQRMKDQGKAVKKLALVELLTKFLETLHINKDTFLNGKPAPRPEIMTKGQIIDELECRNLSTKGSRDMLNERLREDHLSCSCNGHDHSLPKIQGKLSKVLYYTIQKDCMRIDTWTDISLDILGETFTQTFSAYLDLNPCSYLLKVSFERKIFHMILLDYKWGSEEIEVVSPNIKVNCLLTYLSSPCPGGRMRPFNNERHLRRSLATTSPSFQLFQPSSSLSLSTERLQVFFGRPLLLFPSGAQVRAVLMPVYFKDPPKAFSVEFYHNDEQEPRHNTSLSHSCLYSEPVSCSSILYDTTRATISCGNGSIGELLKHIGMENVEDAFNLILKKFDLDDVITSEEISLPPSPMDCPVKIDPTKYLDPSTKHMLRCVQPSSCWGIECSLHLAFNLPDTNARITRNVAFSFSLDPCDFSIEIKFGGKILIKSNILQFEFGKQAVLTFGSGNPPPVKIVYKISKIEESRGFLVDMRLTICFPIVGNKFCIPNEKGFLLLENQEIRECGSIEYIKFQNFSLTNWIREKGLPADKTLDEGALMLLLEQLNLTHFFQQEKCDQTRPPYIPSIQGINNDCPGSIANLPLRIPSPMSCYIPDYCTGVECCAEIPVLGLGLHLFVNLDLNKLELSYGVENKIYKVKLFDYIWGDEVKVSVDGNLIAFIFSIKPLTNRDMYIFNAHVSVCLDDGDCSIKIPIFSNTKIPAVRKMLPHDQKFSLTNWMKNMNIASLTDLKDNAKTLLIQQLQIDKFLLDATCDIHDDAYSPSKKGWSNDCPLDWVVPPAIPFHNVKCALTENCTRIDCCVDFSLLNLKLHFSLHFDRCNYVISGGIEKKTFSYGLLDFNNYWGKEMEFNILNIVQMRFKANQLPVSKKYIIDLSLAICLEPNKCEFNASVFHETLMPVLECDLSMGFKSKGFSLTNWMNEQGLSLEGSLSSALSNSLFKLLGIDSFMKEKSCSRSEKPYSINKLQKDGWSSECPVHIPISQLRGSASCNIKESCTAVSCCIEVGKIGRTFEVELDIDFCNQKITFGIEKLTESLSLQLFDFGTRKEMVIMGVVKLGFTIWDNYGEGVYVVSADVSICLEDGGDCLINVDILNKAKLPKQSCIWETNFHTAGFSLRQFMKDNVLRSFEGIQGLALEELKEELGLPQFLSNPSCSLSSAIYRPSRDGIKNECPKPIGSLPSLPSNMRCAVTESCTGIDCCIGAAPIHHNFHVYLDIDPCSLKMEFGIDKLQFQLYLQEFEFGVEKDVRLANVVRMRFTIWDLAAEDQFLINFRTSICFESYLPCLLDVVIFKELRLPKKECEFGQQNSNFSLHGWKSSMGLTMNTLESADTDRLMEYLGIAGYLRRNQCSAERGINTIKGWNDECPKSSLYQKPDLSALPVLCSISTKCTEIHCCLDVKPVGRSFEAFIDLDPCYKTLELGIEEYSIEDLEDKYLVNMKIDICIEKGQPCFLSHDIAKDLYLPKTECHWSFNPSGFSISEWYKNMTLTPGSVLSTTYLSMLKESLGITNFLLPREKQCDRRSAVYLPQTEGQAGWKIDCPLDVGNMTQLTSSLPISCHLMSHCTAVECCLDFQDPLQQTIHFLLNLDLCLQTLKVGIEKLSYEKTLFSYQYGVEDSFILMDVVQLRYKIEDIDRSDLELTAEIKICLEEKTCVYESLLFDKQRIPKPGCNWNLNFTVPDFSLTNWYSGIGADIGSQLSTLDAAKLLEELGIAKYMKGVPCQRSGPVYSPAVNGWKKDCQLEVDMMQISDSVTCLVKDSCTSVSCCMDVGFMKTSFESYLTLDACNYWMEVGIEKLSFNISLKDVTLGIKNQFYLNSVIRIDYMIEDLPVERQFRVSLTLKACFEASDDSKCLINIDVFKNTLVPKSICDWTASFSTPNFDLDAWYSNLGISPGSVLSLVNKDKLLNELGIRSYLSTNPCSFTSQTFSPANSDGWKNDCKKDLTNALPTLPSNVRCNIPSFCTGVTCCIEESKVLRRQLTVGVELDDCNHVLTFQVEQLKIKIQLHDYSFGVTEKRYLMNVVQFEFRIDEVPAEKAYKISASLNVCYGVGPCTVDSLHLLKDFKLPKTLCEWGTGFQKDFSGTSWLLDKGLSLDSVLSSADATDLLSTLGIQDFLKTADQCDRSSSLYSPNIKGWKNECPNTGVPSPLPSSVSCHIPQLCTGIDCCAEIGFLGGRTINVQVLMDPCEAIMSLNIEKMQYNLTLFDYDFGTTDHFTLQGAIRIDFNIQNLVIQRKYLVNMNLSLCLESSNPTACVYSAAIFRNALLPKKPCNMNLDFINPSFDLTSWKTLNNFGPTLSPEETKLLWREIGLEEYVGVGCSKSSPPYSPHTHPGWNVPT